MAGIYFLAQLIGAVVGYGLLKALTPYRVFNENAGDYGFCATAPQPDLNTFQVFMHEYLATMFLITLCCSVWDQRNAKNTDSIPLKFGLAIMVLSMIFVSQIYSVALIGHRLINFDYFCRIGSIHWLQHESS